MLKERERMEREEVRPRIYVYRYMWKCVNSDKIQLKVVSDVIQSHELFRKVLQEDSNILSAMCEYVCEYDPYFIAVNEVIKKENKKEVES